METNQQKDEIEIDLRQIFGLLWHKAVIIIMTGMVVAIMALLGSKFLLKPVYESKTTLYVINRQNEGTTTFTDIQSSTQLTKDYRILVKSRAVTEQVISELGLDMSSAALASSITVNIQTDARVLEIAVQNQDQYMAKEIADKVAAISAVKICNIMQIEAVNIIDDGEVPSGPVSPNVRNNTLIGGILGILLASAIVIIRFLLNDTIRTADDIERYLGISTLALIPTSDELDDGADSKKKKKKKPSPKKNTERQGKQ